MKYTKILLFLAITMLSLTACKKTEQAEPVPVETIIAEETIENEDVETTEVEDAETTEIETETTSENISVETADTTEGALNPVDNITANPDGTYSFTDEFLVAVQSINGAAGLTEENLNKMLQEVAPLLLGLAEYGINNEADVIGIIESHIGMYEYDQAVEQQQQRQQQNQKPSGGGSSNNQSSNNQKPSGGGGDNAAGPGPLDSIFANPEDGTFDMTLGEGDGTHVGIGH